MPKTCSTENSNQTMTSYPSGFELTDGIDMKLHIAPHETSGMRLKPLIANSRRQTSIRKANCQGTWHRYTTNQGGKRGYEENHHSWSALDGIRDMAVRVLVTARRRVVRRFCERRHLHGNLTVGRQRSSSRGWQLRMSQIKPLLRYPLRYLPVHAPSGDRGSQCPAAGYRAAYHQLQHRLRQPDHQPDESPPRHHAASGYRRRDPTSFCEERVVLDSRTLFQWPNPASLHSVEWKWVGNREPAHTRCGEQHGALARHL